ncbi:hypothetical protein [Plantibacter sp. RU18]|uniref:hypothetical protein n=1 Tax=Plantibacter sp. RU18 TaxID=3158143 RepID=UPI003D364E4D
MAVKTVWNITHSCGHESEKDLSAKAAGERAGFAEWLGGKPCFDCFRATSAGTDNSELQAAREQLEQEAKADAERLELPELAGSEKQTAWGFTVRHKLVKAAYEVCVEAGEMSDETFETMILSPARLLDKAGWWIDNRESEPADLAELVADAGGDEDATTTENPYA